MMIARLRRVQNGRALVCQPVVARAHAPIRTPQAQSPFKGNMGLPVSRDCGRSLGLCPEGRHCGLAFVFIPPVQKGNLGRRAGDV